MVALSTNDIAALTHAGLRRAENGRHRRADHRPGESADDRPGARLVVGSKPPSSAAPQVGALSSDDIAAITTAALNAIKTGAIAALTTLQVSALTTNQIHNLATAVGRRLNTTDIAFGLSTDDIVALTSTSSPP